MERVFLRVSKPKKKIPKETESVPLHSDSPSQIDRLGRQYYAKALAIRLERIYNSYAEPFFLHIHGSWGSGKSTILNLIEKELANDQAESNKRHNRRIRLRCRNWVIVRS